MGVRVGGKREGGGERFRNSAECDACAGKEVCARECVCVRERDREGEGERSQ